MKKNILIFLFLLSGMVAGEIRAQSLIIRFNDGSEISDELNTIRTLTFPAGNLLVNFTSGSTDTWALSTIRKLYFNTITGIGENELRAARNMNVYPNPSSTRITVTGIPEETGSAAVFGMDGRPVMTGEVVKGEVVFDITGLRPGLYLVNAWGLTAKFVRQ